jgi:rubrerythrin
MEKETIKAGMNRTGIMISPINAAMTEKGAIKLTHPSIGDSSAIGNNRIRYALESDPVGTIPIPTSLKGVASSVVENMVFGQHIFLDKLGERIAFERSGVRLYEALISKYYSSSKQKNLPPIEKIEEFFLEERKHFDMACAVMVKLGGDPTAMTPAADVVGVASMGWVQVLADPRTSFLQSLEIILQAELVDNACWELLIEMAQKLGIKNAVADFQIALEEEQEHLVHVKQWVQELTMEGSVSH